MKRAVAGCSVVFMAVALNTLLTSPARADCADELRSVRGMLADVKDESRRQELQRLIEKAEKDERAGRDQLCDEAVQRAHLLLK